MNIPFFFQRRFLPMWTGQCLGAITDNALKQALLIGLPYGVFTIADINGDKLVPFMGALFGIGMMIFSPYGGQFADKYETSFMFRRTKFIEFLIMSLAAIGFYYRDGISLTVALFLMAAQSAFFNPSRISAMPKYLSTKELMPGNAFCNAGLYACIMVGYVIGGGLVEKPDGPVTIAGLMVVLSFLGWMAVQLSPKRAADDPELKIDYNWFRQVGRLVTYVKAEPSVVRPIAGVFLFYYIGTAITVVLALYVRDTLGASGVVATMLMATFTIGTLIGALSIAVLAKGRSGLGISAIAMCVAGVASVVIYFISLPELLVDVGGCRGAVETGDCRGIGEFFTGTRQYLLVGLFLVSSMCTGMYIVPLQTAIQRRVQPTHRAQIVSAGNILNAFAAILGSMSIYAVTQTSLTPHQAFLVAAFIQFGIAAYMLKRKSDVPEGLYDEMLDATASS
ncbi:MAG: MFS transporter [Parvularculaceae bacterium]